jgi:Fibronectin type III domain
MKTCSLMSKATVYLSSVLLLYVAATELVIENLKPATTYTFRIRAKNEVGVGHYTEQIVRTENYSK